MDSGNLHALDARISALEAELQRLKTQRLRHLGRQPRPLDGIRVFDLSRLIFGPFCTQILADMGADVIKVEPHTGDQARRSGTVFINGESASFLARNRNKRSIILDLRQPAAQEIAHRLIQRSDVLVHNFRPGVMARLGLDAKRVQQLNPHLVYCSLTGYGQTGPRADWPGQDLLIQAMSGIISTTGWEDGPRDRGHVHCGHDRGSDGRQCHHDGPARMPAVRHWPGNLGVTPGCHDRRIVDGSYSLSELGCPPR